MTIVYVLSGISYFAFPLPNVLLLITWERHSDRLMHYNVIILWTDESSQHINPLALEMDI